MTETFTHEELIERAEKAEAEVVALLASLQSTESAMGRAMELGSEWRKEAAELRAQMLADQGQYVAQMMRLRKALSFYADPADYKAPFTGGMGKLWSDCGTVARTALSSIRPPNTPGDGELTMGDG